MSMDQLMALVPIESSKGVSTNPKAQGRKSRWERSPGTFGRGAGKKRSLWGRKDDKPYLPPPYIDVPPGLTPSRLDQFLREQRLEELTFKIACGEVEDADPDIRAPSPPPVYDRNGNRTNTRDVRIRNAMNAEQQALVEYCVKTIEGYAPPLDFRPQKKIKRIFIPQEKFPDYNFMGLIIGPRGCNHKRLELESGAQISIRGKGTQKEGKKTDQTDEEANMAQHVHIAADSSEKVEKAVNLIEPLLDPFHPMHEDFKKRGLEQLALVNGVQMAKVEQRCAVCCAVGHLAWECPEMELQSFKRAQVKCNYCGDMGHVTMDCKLAKEAGVPEVDLRAKDQFAQQRATGGPPPPPPPPPIGGAFGAVPEGYDSAAMDREYKKMMAELTGEPLPDSATGATGGIPGLSNGFATGEDDSTDSAGGQPPPPPGEPVATRGTGTGIPGGGMQQRPHQMMVGRGGMQSHPGMMGVNPYSGGGMDYNAAAMQQYYNMYYGGMHHGMQQQHMGMHHAAAAYGGGAGVMAGHGPMGHHGGAYGARAAHAAAYHQQQAMHQHAAYMYSGGQPHMHQHMHHYGGGMKAGGHYGAAMQHAMVNGTGNPYMASGYPGGPSGCPPYISGSPASRPTYATGGEYSECSADDVRTNGAVNNVAPVVGALDTDDGTSLDDTCN